MSRSLNMLLSVGLIFFSCVNAALADDTRARDTPAPASVDTYRRRDVSFYQEQVAHPLTQILVKQFKSHLSRFDYHTLPASPEFSLATYLQKARQYQREQAGRLAAQRRMITPDEQRFGTHVLSLSETRAVMDAAFVFAPRWKFSPMTLSEPLIQEIREDEDGDFPGLEDLPSDTYVEDLTKTETRYNSKTGEETEEEVAYKVYFQVEQRSNLNLKLTGHTVTRETSAPVFGFDDVWSFARANTEHILRNEDIQAANRWLAVRGRKPITYRVDRDLMGNYYGSELVNADALQTVPRLRPLLEADPEQVFMPRAREELEANSAFYGLWMALRKAPEFQLVGQVEQISEGRVRVNLGDFETPERLKLRQRDVYVLEEWQQTPEGNERRRFGFGRVRGFDADAFFLQPLTGRPVELGDMVREYPQWGYNFSYGVQTYIWGEGAAVLGTLSTEWYFNNALAGTPANPGWADDTSLVMGLGIGSQISAFVGPYWRNFWGPLGWGYGIYLQGFDGAANPDASGEEVSGLALVPELSLSYTFTPELSLEMGASWRLSLPALYSGPGVHLRLNNFW